MTKAQESAKSRYEELRQSSDKATDAIRALEAYTPKDKQLRLIYIEQRQSLLKVLKKIHSDAKKEIQKIRDNCEHDMWYSGHDHSGDAWYECQICEHSEIS